MIHTVGPVWRGGGAGEAELLAACYRRASSGRRARGGDGRLPGDLVRLYGYPVADAARVAVGAVRGHELDLVRFVLYNDEAYEAFARAAAA